jgi:hypothetical protein
MGECGINCTYLQFDAVYRTDNGIADPFGVEQAVDIIGQDHGVAVVANKNSGSMILDLYRGEKIDLVLPEGVKGCGVMLPVMEQLADYKSIAHNTPEEMIERFLISNYFIPCCEMNARLNGSFYEF